MKVVESLKTRGSIIHFEGFLNDFFVWFLSEPNFYSVFYPVLLKFVFIFFDLLM